MSFVLSKKLKRYNYKSVIIFKIAYKIKNMQPLHKNAFAKNEQKPSYFVCKKKAFSKTKNKNSKQERIHSKSKAMKRKIVNNT